MMRCIQGVWELNPQPVGDYLTLQSIAGRAWEWQGFAGFHTLSVCSYSKLSTTYCIYIIFPTFFFFFFYWSEALLEYWFQIKQSQAKLTRAKFLQVSYLFFQSPKSNSSFVKVPHFKMAQQKLR